ncbi:hypothetical protein DITRI_Ditri18aG0125200 [Diplodiscus trichospermus]
MTTTNESAKQKPSSSKQQAQEENSPQNAPGDQERTGQDESNVSQPEKSSGEGDNVKMSQGGDDQEKIEQNKTNVTQTEGEAETEGSRRGNMKGQCSTPADLENKGGQSESGASAGGSSSSTHGRTRRSHVGSSSGSKAKKKRQLMDVPSGVPGCYVCRRPFSSWKAVFGHLRAHRRDTPGAFPPPTFTPKGSPERKNGDKPLEEQLAPTLFNLALETMQNMSQDSNNSAAAGLDSSLRRCLDIDLNKPATSFLLDLNHPPPAEKDEDDDDDDDDEKTK